MNFPTKRRGFILETIDYDGNPVIFHLCQDHHTEQILRGLIHSGYEATVKEAIIDIPLPIIEMLNWEREQEETHQKSYESDRPRLEPTGSIRGFDR